MDDRRASSLAGDLIKAAAGESVSVLKVGLAYDARLELVCHLRLFHWSGRGLATGLFDWHKSIVIRFDKVRDLFSNPFCRRP